MKLWRGKPADKWLTYAAILVVVLAVIGAVALQLSRNAAAKKAEQAQVSVDRTKATFADDASQPLKLGSVAELGPDYKVAVSKVTLHEGSVNPFLVVAVKAKNMGRDVSHPRGDLAVGFSKPGSRRANESTCQVDVGKLNISDQTSLAVGGVQSFAVCINLPTNELKGGWISVEANGTGDQAHWTTSGRVPRVVSTATPEIHMVVPAAPTASPKTLHDLKKQIKKAKKARDTLDKQIKAYKKLPDHKKKKLKKFEKARDKLDDAIDQMEDIQKQLE